MKNILIIVCLTFLANLSIAQKAKWVENDMTTYHAFMTRLNNLHDIKLCDCKEGKEAYYLYTIHMLRTFTVDSSEYLYHDIAIIETDKKRKKKTATIYKNMNIKDTIPKSGWKSFFSTMDKLDLNNMVSHFSAIPHTVIKSPDGSLTLFLYCKDGWLRPHIMMKELEIVTSNPRTPESSKTMSEQLSLSRQIFELFYDEF